MNKIKKPPIDIASKEKVLEASNLGVIESAVAPLSEYESRKLRIVKTTPTYKDKFLKEIKVDILYDSSVWRIDTNEPYEICGTELSSTENHIILCTNTAGLNTMHQGSGKCSVHDNITSFTDILKGAIHVAPSDGGELAESIQAVMQLKEEELNSINNLQQVILGNLLSLIKNPLPEELKCTCPNPNCNTKFVVEIPNSIHHKHSSLINNTVAEARKNITTLQKIKIMERFDPDAFTLFLAGLLNIFKKYAPNEMSFAEFLSELAKLRSPLVRSEELSTLNEIVIDNEDLTDIE